ncbi:MAG: DUF4249 domain-containing protein [Allomuricauda sp.]
MFFRIIQKAFLFYAILLFTGCVDPIEPVFENREGLIYVNAFLATSKELSSMGVYESVLALRRNQLEYQFIGGAVVTYLNIDTGEEVVLQENELDENYELPDGFTISVGDTWQLTIVLPDGRVYKSSEERVKNPVPILDVRATYNPELLFSESENSFIPGHRISVDLEDPPEDENFYLWQFRSFESLKLCLTCLRGTYYRNGECIPNPYDRRPLALDEKVLDYGCETKCWRIRYNEDINLFGDEFSNGNRLTNLPAGNVPLYSKENISVEVQQYSLSSKAYEYYRVINDIVVNNGSLNAPPPAALIGNMFNPNDDNETVLGRFTAAASSSASVFINRSEIAEDPIERFRRRVSESCETVCPSCISGPGPSCPIVLDAVCEENRFRTGKEPEGWQEID